MARTSNLRSRSLMWTIVGAAGVALLAFGAFLFVSSFSTGRSLDDAARLRNTDVTLAGQDVAIKSIGQLVLVSQDAQLGVADQSDVDLAAVEAERAVAEFGARFSELNDSVTETMASSFDAWQTAAGDVIALAVSGAASDAEDQLTTVLAPSVAELTEQLSEERDALAQAVANDRDGLSALARFAGFVTVFLIPLIAILFYRLTARRQLQEATAHLDARIEAEKENSREKDQFVSNVSSELRGPATSIRELSGQLIDKGLTATDADDLVDRINREASELARRADDLLIAARGDGTAIETEKEVVEMEQELAAALAPLQSRGVTVGGTWGPGSVLADPDRVRQILRNLLTNAVEHGGSIIRVYGDAAGSNYVLSVEDDGPGLPAELANTIFAGTGTSGGGSGLGLAVGRTLAQAMGGSLDYERVAGFSAFVLSLPLAEVQVR